MKNLKMNKKRTEKILTFRSRDLCLRFSVTFPSMIFIQGEGEKIKSKQAPNRDRTLPGELC